MQRMRTFGVRTLGLANWTASVRSSGFWSEKVSLFFAKRQMSMVVRSN